jgi:hypothetical protein
MAETPQGSSECVNMGYGEPKFNFLLSWACPNGFKLARPRWYSIHIWHLNPLASRNDDKVWTQKFGLFWCNIWHKPKPNTLHPLFCLQIKLCISITHLSCVHDVTFCWLQYSLYAMMVLMSGKMEYLSCSLWWKS